MLDISNLLPVPSQGQDLINEYNIIKEKVKKLEKQAKIGITIYLILFVYVVYKVSKIE